MEARSIARYVRVSPRKARLVIDQIRGIEVERAREILKFSDRNVAEVIEKCLNSAVANAEQAGASADALSVVKTYVDEGPTLKRFRPRAKGSASRIRKRTCHITVIVDAGVPKAKKPSRNTRAAKLSGNVKQAKEA